MQPDPNKKPMNPIFNYVTTGMLGMVLVFGFGTMEAVGSTTSTMKNIGNYGGGVLCLISMAQGIQEVKRRKDRQ
jgi:hypothetical protein